MPDTPLFAATPTSGFDVIDRAECLRLLTVTDVGRVIYTENALPAAHPVTYVLAGEEVFFRTGSRTKAAAASKGAVFALQVDAIDFDDLSGWSVLGVGQAYEVTDPDRLADLDRHVPRPWLPDHDEYTIGIVLSRLNGRRVRRSPD
ncbi:pyridoxamine 5'-phosphate oxidase family protein [Pseudonocardia halophobica]|uniref:pyridoxamine 5'-phosphate oxidase family protein n=1 Tax=Pseudonocardia halophobica TaxID=29401 RepID=UPI003D9370EA